MSEYLINPCCGRIGSGYKNIEKQTLRKETKPEVLGRLENIILGIIFGVLILMKTCANTEEKYEFRHNRPFGMVQIYSAVSDNISREKETEEFHHPGKYKILPAEPPKE